MLFRAEYTRDGKVRHMTFAKRNDALALLYFIEVLSKYIESIGGKDATLLSLP